MYTTMTVEAVLSRLQTDAACGLTEEGAGVRREQSGDNVLVQEARDSIFKLFLAQFKDAMVFVLLAAAAVSLALTLISGRGDFADPILIMAIVVFNAVIGVVQEYRASKALDALKSMSAPTAEVLRGGKRVTLPAAQLVCGDILYLKAGDFVGADARLLESVSLKTDESALTGESDAVCKDASYICTQPGSVAEAKNMVWASTAVTAGHAVAVVTATGMRTQVGKIAGMLKENKAPMTPLQERLARTGKVLGFGALGICALIFLMGILRSFAPFEMFMTAVSLAVAAIPEGLPTIVTVLLATGIRTMAAKNAIVRRLPAVETLGSATVICSDKTGTLTQNKMTVTRVYGNRDFVLDMAALCSNGIGATEAAIVNAAEKGGFVRETMEGAFVRIRENPFTSEKKYMSTLHRCSGGYRLIVKGAPDVVLRHCDLSEQARRDFLAENKKMATQALRVLAVAYKDTDSIAQATEDKLIFAGLIGMMDPPRPEAAQAVRLCRQAGIRPIMITGDHAETACAIAKQIGIFMPGDSAMTGTQLDAISVEALADCIDDYSVFARVTPEHKVKIVRALQLRRAVVAMTGDGVNDAPALKIADIGCAMGKSGTSVAKEAADLVLTDDNFATIVSAVREGRTIYGNIGKAVRFLLSSNIGEILTIFFAMFVGWQTPLAAIHLLWVNLITDSLPAIALGFEPAAPDVMYKKPVGRAQGLLAGGAWFSVCIEGIMIGTLSLIAFSFGMYIYRDYAAAQTMAFCVLALSQLTHAYNMRSEHSVFAVGVFKNKKLNLACGICVLLQLAVLLLPPLRALFNVAALKAAQWGIVLLLSLLPLALVELEKLAGKYLPQRRVRRIKTARL